MSQSVSTAIVNITKLYLLFGKGACIDDVTLSAIIISPWFCSKIGNYQQSYDSLTLLQITNQETRTYLTHPVFQSITYNMQISEYKRFEL